jgi:hypothetical protein
MNHPKREEWVEFLYEEIAPAEKARLEQHLESCPACREQLQTWRGTMSALDAYEVAAPARPLWRRSGLRWAAAAAAMLAIGIGLGSALQARGSSAASVAELRARVEKAEAENAKTKQLLVDLAQTMNRGRARDEAALLAMAREVELTRKDLETVAVRTELGLKSTESQLVRLASYNTTEAK